MHHLSRLLKSLAVLFSLALCVWCAAEKLDAWAKTFTSAPALPASPTPTPQTTPVWSEDALSSSQDQGMLDLPDDGVVPIHSDLLPDLNVTPDPNRSWKEVQELQLDGGTQVGNFFVRDSTGSGTDLEAALAQEPDVHIKADGSVEVLIYHTHTSESYAQSAPGFYYTDMETRTQNQDLSVVAAGEELAKALESRGIGVVHDKTVNDSAYNGSYDRSWNVIQSNLEKHPGIQVTIDLHRDSMTTEEGIKYKPTAQIEGRKAAQAMIIAGCDADGSWGDFPDWEYNLRLILKVQQTAQALYPGLMRPLNFSNSKYNMNATHGSMLIEVGTEVNTVGEARYTGQLLGEILAQTLKNCE